MLRGKIKIGSFVKDEKWKIASSDACCYCDSELQLTLDHLIPQFKGGEHSADNLVVACRSCNSSKKALDLLEWMAKRGEFPPLDLLRRYLKLAIRYCIANDLMGVVLVNAENNDQKQGFLFDDIATTTKMQGNSGPGFAWPFAIDLIPHMFPDPVDLWAQAMIEDDEQPAGGTP